MTQAEPADGEPNPDTSLFVHAWKMFAEPLLLTRLASGHLPPDLRVTAFEIRLPLNGEPSIQLNGEEAGWSRVRSDRSYADGEEFDWADQITEHVPVSDDPETPYIRAVLIDGQWYLDFHLGHSSPKRFDHLAIADEFLASAHDDLAHARPRAAYTAAFYAAEHLAKAELLHYSMTTEVIDGSKSHRHVRSTYSTWARLGNTDARFAAVLEALDRDRGVATYADGEWDSIGDLPGHLATLDDMRAWVADVVNGRGPRAINAVAKRQIDAGTIVGPDDVGLRPQKSSRGPGLAEE